MRIIFSCGHSGSGAGTSARTTNGRAGAVLSKPIIRIAGFEVRYR